LYEIPAGMLDGNGDFGYVAAKELREETGISINKDDPAFVDLTAMMYGADSEGVYPSAGGCDEFMRIFLYTAYMTKVEIDAINGRKTGMADEGESIKVAIVPFHELARKAPDMKTLSALALYNAMKSAEIFSKETTLLRDKAQRDLIAQRDDQKTQAQYIPAKEHPNIIPAFADPDDNDIRGYGDYWKRR
jgi:8-oxo-dGTP pyrophosphatase MutT (NUDIX family)